MFFLDVLNMKNPPQKDMEGSLEQNWDHDGVNAILPSWSLGKECSSNWVAWLSSRMGGDIEAYPLLLNPALSLPSWCSGESSWVWNEADVGTNEQVLKIHKQIPSTSPIQLPEALSEDGNSTFLSSNKNNLRKWATRAIDRNVCSHRDVFIA